MKRASSVILLLALGLPLLFTAPALAQHRATRLGHPATRFAPTMHTPEDLRDRFRDEKLRPDIASILAQWGWAGNLEDLHRAALTQEISEWPIAIGTRMPFMSSRKDGVAICLRDVLWAGTEPAPAYAFTFSSRGQRYRCITPKACSNFFLVDLGPEPKPVPKPVPVPALALVCQAPPREFTGRPFKVCFTVRNPGDAPEPQASLTLPLPPGATFHSATEGGSTNLDHVLWDLGQLAPNASREVCVTLTMRTPGKVAFKPTANGVVARPAQCECQTLIIGIHSLGVEVVDLEDPIEVGKVVTYVITITNQGDQVGTGIRITCTVPDSQEFVFGSGTTPVRATGRALTMEVLPTLDAKAKASWRVLTKALRPDDSRFRVEFSSDQFEKPIHEDESTRLY
ncbi:MAG: hypothetical protein RL514_2766 [Verrucomicrobiota bacterium]|jgi:uncharacterized repeat protein (TIGR01451 family)